MEINIEPGTYVVAVSGGVDSMVLLNILSKMPRLKLIVAHYDHGIRPDSNIDRELVQTTAANLGLPFVFDQGNLGPNTSEAHARESRYNFLRKVKDASGAKAIITAHQEDDLIETAIINMLRGTNRHGLSALKNQPDILRPLLTIPKAKILEYANEHKIEWREDPTNEDEVYLRNYVRKNILPRFSLVERQKMLAHIDKLSELNKEIDAVIEAQISTKELDRHWFTLLDHAVARDVMASWLRHHGVKDLDKKRLEILVRAAKTYKPGKQIVVDKSHKIEVNDTKLAL